eukprot:TRINITY_DN12414_c0_g1_i3.p1 TRINITY_DN12414_c0_g1~~TRINITY_DN12414_c0_g1_i3.p1  ORF type:complete len:798 (-),score=193.37 TRINITY_DN12414_c0_g1_i3:225-2618(-)
MSMSPWRSRPKQLDVEDDEQQSNRDRDRGKGAVNKMMIDGKSEKKGIWNWKPMRALSHIAMQKLSCLFSVEVIAVQNLPASMNGLRLSVSVRKKETRDGAVLTMPARVLQGSADFEETLFIKCHVYCTNGNSNGGGGKNLKFEPRPFVISVVAVDAEELDFGKSILDLSSLIQESMEKSFQGTRIRQWDMVFDLYGKAKGGELVMKLGFQIMEKDGGLGIYNQGAAEGLRSDKSKDSSNSLFGRKQSKYSFSVTSPRISSRSFTPLRRAGEGDFQGIDDLNLDEPAPVPSTSLSVQTVQKSGLEAKMEDLLDLPEFEVVDKGIEIEDEGGAEEGESLEALEEQSASSEVVKEVVVHDEAHQTRLTELDSIAQQIKALESLIRDESVSTAKEEMGSQRLDAEEETVTREFLQMLEEADKELKHGNLSGIPLLKLEGIDEESMKMESKVFVPDLGKGLGSVVQTRDGGYLAAMNPFDTEVTRKETPKLAMQISKPLILPLQKSQTGFEVFQRMAAIGIEKLSLRLLSAVAMDELMGKTAEQIAFEGVASAIIHGRNKEGASSSAARSISIVKNMAAAITMGRKERISTGIWNVSEDPITVEEILGFSLQKMEAMTVESLKIQAEIAEEDAPFDISSSPLGEDDDGLDRLLASAVSPEDWEKKAGSSSGDTQNVTLLVVVQLRDPMRRYEAVGAPVFALVQATKQEGDGDDDEDKFKVVSLHMGGLNARAGGKRNSWGGEKQRLTAMHWLVAYGLGKAIRKGKQAASKGQDSLWSISARVMADMWLKPMRNPDLKFPKQQ